MGYSPDAYRHNLDQRAFEMLNSFPKFVKLCEAYNANFSEIIAKIDNMSDLIRLNENQVPEDIVKNEGDDYSKYSTDSKKCIASCVSIAVSIKGVLDTQILTDDGLLTDESQNRVVDTEEFINRVVKLESKVE